MWGGASGKQVDDSMDDTLFWFASQIGKAIRVARKRLKKLDCLNLMCDGFELADQLIAKVQNTDGSVSVDQLASVLVLIDSEENSCCGRVIPTS